MTSLIEDSAVWIAVVAAAGGILLTLGRRIVRAIAAVARDLRAFRDAILGRDPIVHPDTGRELVPAVPGIGARMANQDARLDRLTTVVETLAQVHGRVDDLEQRVGRLEGTREAERILGKVESIQLMQTMETAIKADPDEAGVGQNVEQPGATGGPGAPRPGRP